MGEKKEYIERVALIRFVKQNTPNIHGDTTMRCVERALKAAPAADVVEVRHGEWKKRGNEKKCSVCDFIYYSNNDEWTYCPNCGERKEQA